MEDKILKLITSDQSWEQVIYEIVAWEGLDPWNIDIGALSSSFIKYIEKASELDFKIPAKYVIIAAILLRMKSDHLEFLDLFKSPEEEGGEVELGFDKKAQTVIDGELPLLELPPRRLPQRKILINDLIFALRNALRIEDRRIGRKRRAIEKIEIRTSNIMEKIADLYMRIDQILAKLKEKEIKFSNLVEKWERDEILDTFLPLIFLEDEKKISCRQEEIFGEIFVSKRAEMDKKENN